MDFIERHFVSPDGGDGTFEIMIRVYLSFVAGFIGLTRGNPNETQAEVPSAFGPKRKSALYIKAIGRMGL
jgi:hypothetical protein